MALIGFGNSKPKPAAGGDTSGAIKDGTDKGFMDDVVKASMETPVLVDFWAPWCGPCRTLTPTIEKVVLATKGKVKLVKINIDENPAYAGQLRVQSIPAVFAFKDGKPVDAFMGAQPESQIKAFVERLVGQVPAGIDDLLAAGAESLAIDDIGGAAQSYAQAASLDPENPKALAGLARCYILGEDFDRAREVLQAIQNDKAKDPDVVATQALLTLMLSAAHAGDPQPLFTALANDTGNHQIRYDLAQAFIKMGDFAAASDALLTIVQQDRTWNNDAARKQLLLVFDAAGSNSDVARNGRRRLSTILFS
jgi:putative thioredoxin